ncbi:MAG: EamA family transporter [Bacteroidetes bacterium]|nr:EamA family transporter [Bacteroidota bacterium]
MQLKFSVIQQREKRIPALLALGIVSFLWGTTWVASRQGVRYMPPIQLAGIRQFLAGSIYVIYFLFKGAKWPHGKEWLNVFILSVLNLFLTNGLTTLGVKYISGGLGAIIAAIFPLWLVIIGFFTTRSKVSTKVLIGLLLGFGGVCVIFFEHLKDFFDVDFRFGIMISFIASLCWAFGTLYTKQLAKEFNPYFSIGLQMLISGILLFSISAAAGWNIPMSQIPAKSWIAIGYLVIFGSVISFMAYLYALQNLPTAQVSIYAYINPIVAVIFGSLLFGEKITIFIGIGGLITLYGIYLVNSSFLKKNRS